MKRKISAEEETIRGWVKLQIKRRDKLLKGEMTVFTRFASYARKFKIHLQKRTTKK